MKLSKGIIALIVAGGLLFLVGGWIAATRNGFVTKSNAVTQAEGNLASAYQRRFDLIPGLVESVKGSQLQEQKVFGDLADARSRYAGASTNEQRIQAGEQTNSALGRLLVVMENYPQLTSNQNVQNLMVQLEGTENRVKVERDNYTKAVTDYNNAVQVFPGNIVAGLFGYDKKQVYTAQNGAEQAPKVDFTPDTPTTTEATPAPAAQ